jgi:hypothetical protein
MDSRSRESKPSVKAVRKIGGAGDPPVPENDFSATLQDKPKLDFKCRVSLPLFAVAQICNRRRTNQQVIVEQFTARGLHIRDTAGCRSALRGQCQDAPALDLFQTIILKHQAISL